MDRLASLHAQLLANPTSATATYNTGSVSGKSPNDVVICSFARTPITRAKRGGFKDTRPEQLLSLATKGAVERARVDPKLVDEFVYGNTLAFGQGSRTWGRMSMFYAGLPPESGLMAVNRMCASGLQACVSIAESIIAGRINCGVGAGVESMSFGKFAIPDESIWDGAMDTEYGEQCIISDGLTSENVAEDFKVTREEQDQLAVESHAKAAYARKNGLFAKEIIPVKTVQYDKQGNEKQVTISQDDGIREGTTLKVLGKLRPAFKKNGTTTAGNSSQISDGAAAVVLARRSFAEKHGLPIVARLSGSAVAGLPPRIMGIGPVFAIPKVLKQTGLKLEDIDLFEINEAFASQAAYCTRKLGLDKTKVNPKGGAIALGHPLGMTGARMVGALITELQRTNKRRGIASMCMGGGFGMAAVIELE